MTRHWAPMDGPQRAMMRLRARRDGLPRSTVDLELPLMVLLAVLVGIGVVIWLNGQGSPDSGEIRRVTERPVLTNPREAQPESSNTPPVGLGLGFGLAVGVGLLTCCCG